LDNIFCSWFGKLLLALFNKFIFELIKLLNAEIWVSSIKDFQALKSPKSIFKTSL